MAVLFNGIDQSVSLGLDVPFTGGQSVLTMTAWCRPRNITTNIIVASFAVGPPPGASGNTRFSIDLNHASAGNGTIQIRGRAGDGDSVRLVNTSTNFFEPDQPMFLVATIDYTASIHTLFVDGELAFQGPPGTAYPQPTTAATNSKSAAVGSNSAFSSAFFDGWIEDFRLYSRAVTESEAMTMFAAQGTDGILNNLIYRLPLLGQPGKAVSDPVADISNVRSGIIVGSPTYTVGICKTRKSPFKRPTGALI